MPARRLLVAALAALAAGCGQPGSPQSLATRVPPEAALVQFSIAGAATAIRSDVLDAGRADLLALYEPEAYAPLWLDHTGRPTAQVSAALDVLAHAADDGLDPDDYDVQALAARAGRSMDDGTAPTLAEIAGFDTGVSAALLTYFHDLHQGRVDPRALGFQSSVSLETTDYPSLLRTAIADHRVRETAAELAPAIAPYRALRDALARYRALAADPDLQPPSVVPTTIHPGDLYPSAAALARLLRALGDLPSGADPGAWPSVEPSPYDGALVEGVRHFQARHGLEPDGVLGRTTQDALAIPLASRVRQIEFALERLRWFPPPAADRLVLVNIPMFEAWAWDGAAPDGPPGFTSRVVVGRAVKTQTPVFAAEMRYIIFRPYWNVPVSIARNEILPAVARDPGYLDAEHMEIVMGEGDDAAAMPATAENLTLVAAGLLRIRQRPGPTNALGLVKFVFPNDADVYLHGTPAMNLFARARRDFSHGCVRVEDAFGLAEWVLAGQDSWTRAAIDAAAAGERSARVDLARPVQVLLFYSTAWPGPEDGTIRFADDIYGSDAALGTALTRRHVRRLRPYQVRTRPVSTWTKFDAG